MQPYEVPDGHLAEICARNRLSIMYLESTDMDMIQKLAQLLQRDTAQFKGISLRDIISMSLTPARDNSNKRLVMLNEHQELVGYLDLTILSPEELSSSDELEEDEVSEAPIIQKVDYIYVRREYQGQQIGKLLMQTARADFRQHMQVHKDEYHAETPCITLLDNQSKNKRDQKSGIYKHLGFAKRNGIGAHPRGAMIRVEDFSRPIEMEPIIIRHPERPPGAQRVIQSAELVPSQSKVDLKQKSSRVEKKDKLISTATFLGQQKRSERIGTLIGLFIDKLCGSLDAVTEHDLDMRLQLGDALEECVRGDGGTKLSDYISNYDEQFERVSGELDDLLCGLTTHEVSNMARAYKKPSEAEDLSVAAGQKPVRKEKPGL